MSPVKLLLVLCSWTPYIFSTRGNSFIKALTTTRDAAEGHFGLKLKHTHAHTHALPNGVFLATGKSDGKNKIVTN